jgi:hypothetical protein
MCGLIIVHRVIVTVTEHHILKGVTNKSLAWTLPWRMVGSNLIGFIEKAKCGN